MKACHSVSTALLKSIAEKGTQSAMKSSRKTLHEFTSHIPPKTPKRNRISRSTNEMLFTDNFYLTKPIHEKLILQDINILIINKPKKKILQEKAVEATKKKKKGGKNLSPRNRKACHSTSTALLGKRILPSLKTVKRSKVLLKYY
jgi:thymidylate synthase